MAENPQSAEFHAVTEMPPTGSSPNARGDMPRGLQTALLTLVVLIAMAGLVFTVSLATTGNDNTSAALPDSVDRLIPGSGDEVLAQSPLGVDLANGYDAFLIVNGVEIKTQEDGLSKNLGLGLVQFQPGPGKPIESLNPEQNCVVAMVWQQSEGEEAAEPVSWCFSAA